MMISPTEPLRLIRTFDIHGIPMDIGSDWHFELTQEKIIDRICAHIASAQRSKILLCLGDVFETGKGQDSHVEVLALLRGFSELYEHVLFVPGNHDLRGRDNPWNEFADLPQNVHSPDPADPVVWEHEGTNILLANVFYDMNFLDPALVGLTKEQVLRQYRASGDGKYFLGGDTSLFETMTKNAAVELTPDIHAIATHALPHPSLIQFKGTSTDPSLHFANDLEADMHAAQKKGVSLEAYRRWFNAKCIYMGSNVLGHVHARPSNELTAIYGHHHRNDTRPGAVNGKNVRVATHQMVQKDPRYKVSLPDVQ